MAKKGLTFLLELQDRLSGKLAKASKGMDGAYKRLQKIEHASARAEKKLGGLGKTFKSMNSTFAGWGNHVTEYVLGTISEMSNRIIDSTAEFEKYGAVLANTLGSSKAKKSFSEIIEFASKTPFQVAELTGSFVKLANRGIIPTMGEMTKLGDLASSQGKSFDQLTEALLDATNAEFERLKEFGIKGSKSGNQVSLSFKGVTKTVANTETAIKDALMSFGEMQGVVGGMNAISQTLGGRLSNLSDKADMLAVTIGEAFNKQLGGSLNLLSSLLDRLTIGFDWIMRNGQLITDVSYAFAAALGVIALGVTAVNAKVWALSLSLKVLAGLEMLVNALNPFTLILIAVAALTAGMVLLYNRSETFRGVLQGIGEVAKTVFSKLWGWIKQFWEGFTSVISGVWKLVKPLFDAIWTAVKKVFDFYKKIYTKIFEGIMYMAKKVFGFLEPVLKPLLDAFDKGFSKGKLEIQQKKEQEEKEQGRGLLDRLVPNGKADTSIFGSGKSSGSGSGASAVKDNINGIASGGRRQTNINIQIGKQIETLEIRTENLTEGVAEIGDAVRKVLADVLNSANRMAYN